MAPGSHASGVAVVLPATAHQGAGQRPNGHSVANGSHSSLIQAMRNPTRRPRLLNVDQALQFSPLSSIVPFGPDVIPMPNVTFPGSTSLFTSSAEQQSARQPLDFLNRELSLTQVQSNVAHRVKHDLETLLNDESLTEFKFKSPTKVKGIPDRTSASTKPNGDAPSQTKLSHFADVMLRQSNLAHRYPTPTSPEAVSPTKRKATASNSRRAPSSNGRPVVQIPSIARPPSPPKSVGLQKHTSVEPMAPPHQHPPKQPSSISPTSQSIASNQVAYVQNAKLPVNGMQAPVQKSTAVVASSVLIPTPEKPLPIADTVRVTPQSTKLQPMVVIPPSSPETLRSDVVVYEDPMVNITVKGSRKRKRDSEHARAQFAESLDQRVSSDNTLRHLQDTIQDIFEADGQLEKHAQYFVSSYVDGQEIATLSPAIHVKLESSLQKVISCGRFTEIPVEDLQRLQSLCEGALASAESTDIQVDEAWSSDDFDGWVHRLEAVDLGLRSARTVVLTMSGGRAEKRIYSEEILQSILRVTQKVLYSSIVPIVEARTSSNMFHSAISHKKVIFQLLHDTNKVMSLLANLLAKEEMAETIITPIEFFVVRLLFVENAPNEKESILGIQKYETLRRTAMDMIAVIFSRYPAQRSFLFDEILTSLQKLPTGRQAARQFRLADGKAIQLVSALIIRLVQTSATVSIPATQSKLKANVSAREDESGSGSDTTTGGVDMSAVAHETEESDTSEEETDSGRSGAMRRLNKESASLCDSAAKSAQHAVGYFVQRAQTASKTGDQPHRQLLDIFVEDLIEVLGLPEWPAAEILLRAVCAQAVRIAENPKALAPAKNMSLELLGNMGSAISGLVSNTQHVARGLENQESEFGGHMRQMLDDFTEGSFEISEVLMWGGPYHAVIEYLHSDSSDDLQTTSAQGYYLAQWAKAVSIANLKPGPESEKLALRLRKIVSGVEKVHCDAAIGASQSQIRVAYAMTLLSMDFCRRFDQILKILLDSVTSEQTTVRSRGLKSVTQMLEKDPSLLDRARTVKSLILRCATDTSPMVRDAALTLIGKCVNLKPALETEFLRHILHLTNDNAIGVRKRSMKLLKDIYLRNTSKDVKASIADILLQRAKDSDPGVADIARQTFEEIWICPFWTSADIADTSVQIKISTQEQVALIIKTTHRNEKVRSVMVDLLKDVLSDSSKNATPNYRVCKSFVATAFEIMIDNGELSESLDQAQVLETLTIFAKAKPRLFSSDQLQIMRPYIGSLSSVGDLDVFRLVVVIFRCVIPVLSAIEHGLLEEVQKSLLGALSKLRKAELNEVAECLWTINGTLQKPEPLLKLTVSVLNNLEGLKTIDFADPSQKSNLAKLRRYMMIAGYFGKHCDFEPHSDLFRSVLCWWKGGSVAGLIVQSLKPYVASTQPLALRAVAFDSIGLICQAWPFQFTQKHISNAFESVLRSGEPDLQDIILSSFKAFFLKIERQAEVKTEVISISTESGTGSKLGGSMTASDGDSASALIAQHFLKDVLNIALASQNNSALTATEVIASINRQGLAHPKESGPALVALETSTNLAIADVALQEHRILHQQHESMFEREYMRAIQEAFRYQKEIVNDTLGYTAQPYIAKLSGMWEIIKTSKGKYQKKFLSNYCSKIDFDVTKMDMAGSVPNTLQYSRFLIENLALFEFSRLDELLHAIACMEKIVADTGSGVAHSISTEVFHITVSKEGEDAVGNEGGNEDLQGSQATERRPKAPVETFRLRQLTTASIILSSLWEARTYLRRLYGQNSNQQRRESSKAKAATKDLSKVPSRIQGVTGDKIVSSIMEKVASLDSEDSMMKQCQDFVELLSVDSEVKVNAESDESAGGERPETPGADDDDDERDTPMSGGSRKRKTSVSAAGTPKKKRGRPSLGKRKSSRKSVGEDDDWE